ncbi:hypothetical protein K439DRAFT_1625453 [Ramaria rubella]|nr:hypothetical protein K439DRAFT_1625453 [Ramaria rubella]
MVTANEDIWEKYLKSHEEAQPFKKKLFPLFDRIAELCGDVIATGAGAFSVQALDRSGDLSEEGDESESTDEDDNHGDLPISSSTREHSKVWITSLCSHLPQPAVQTGVHGRCVEEQTSANDA